MATAVLVLAGLPMSPMTMAQGVNCSALRAQVDASAGGAPRLDRFAGALRQQQYELQRTQNYSASIGCNSNFLFDGVPAECDAIAGRIERMQENIGQLRQRMQDSGEDDDRRRALTEQYNAYCVGTGEGSEQPQTLPIDPDTPSIMDDDSPPDDAPRRAGHVRALCVRHCDGGYFPITEDAGSGSIADFDQLCKALCPNTAASLYTAAPSAGIETAVAADGTPYTSLPGAFKFQRTFDAACTCKPPHQSWVEALAEAEKLIESRKGDVTVTQTISEAMSRPAAPGAAPATKLPRKTKVGRKAAKPAPEMSVDGGVAPPALSGEDLMQQLRRDGPTL